MKSESVAKRVWSVAVASVLALLTATAVLGIAEYEGGRLSAVHASSTRISRVSDSLLRKVAVAAPKVHHINVQMTQALSQTKDQQAQRKIVVRAKDKQVDVIHRAGLTVEQYQDTLMAAARNPDIFAKLRKIISTEEST